MTDPLTRIADALERIDRRESILSDERALMWLDDYASSAPLGEVRDELRDRIRAARARGASTPVTPTTNASAPPPDDDPEWRDVLGSELRVGDVIEGEDDARGVVGLNYIPQRVSDPRMHRRNGTYRIRLPRPAAEPSAKAKCPTCRCMIVPGSTCACCESTSGDDPPLPRVDADVEPSASGEGIARLRHTLLEIGAHSWAVGELHDQPWLMASRIVSTINAAHAHATRELRERCERAERGRDEARAAFNGVADERDRAKLDAAKWERERDELRASLFSCATLRTEYQRERDAAIARAEAAERVVTLARRIASGEFGAAPNAVRAFVDTLDAYDAARKDGAR